MKKWIKCMVVVGVFLMMVFGGMVFVVWCG